MLRSSCKSWFNLILDLRSFPKWFVLNQQACALYFVLLGSISCLDYLKSLNFFFSSDLIPQAAASGHFDVVKFLHKSGCKLDQVTTVRAAGSGNIELLEYCIENSFSISEWKDNKLAFSLCYEAAKLGQLHVLKYLHENGFAFDSSLSYPAATNNHLECVKYLLEIRSGAALDSAPGYLNSLEAIQLYIEKCTPKDGWKTFACQNAARLGDLTMLKWAHENGAPWNEALSAAIQCGSLSCLQYMVNNGATIEQTVEMVGSVDVLKFLLEKFPEIVEVDAVYTMATEYMNRDIMAHLSSKSYEKPASLGAIAAQTGNFEFFKWCVEELKFDTKPELHIWDGDYSDILGSALITKNYDFVKYVVDNKLHQPNKNYLEEIQNYSDVRIWKLIYQMGPAVEFPDSMLHAAAANGTGEVLAWFIEHGAKFTELHAYSAASSANPEGLSYLLKHGCKSHLPN